MPFRILRSHKTSGNRTAVDFLLVVCHLDFSLGLFSPFKWLNSCFLVVVAQTPRPERRRCQSHNGISAISRLWPHADGLLIVRKNQKDGQLLRLGLLTGLLLATHPIWAAPGSTVCQKAIPGISTFTSYYFTFFPDNGAVQVCGKLAPILLALIEPRGAIVISPYC
jgi:hypothetical protein